MAPGGYDVRTGGGEWEVVVVAVVMAVVGCAIKDFELRQVVCAYKL